MILFLKILVGFLILWLVLLLILPKGNFVSEGLRLPFWIFKLLKMVKPGSKPEKIKYGNHLRQYLIHHKPAYDAPNKNHVVIYIHGSGWQYGRPEMFLANAQWLTAQGYHAFFVSHRRIPWCDIRELRTDTGLAIKKVVEILAEEGISHKKIILCGNSAGGNLCALAMFDQTLLAEVGLSSEIFSALALFGSPLDLSAMWPSPPLLMVTRMKNPAVFNLANPIHFVETSVKIPTLLIHGEKDGIVEYGNSKAFFDKLQLLGSENIRFETLKDGLHLDSASWCFPDHPCCEIFGSWLERIENQQEV